MRILHISDLHFGARSTWHDATFGIALVGLIEALDPALVITTGDLTHRGTAAQHAAAAEFLHSLERPLLVVPGNHDVPYTLPGRFTHPWRGFKRAWGTTDPLHVSPGLCAVGLNSARPLRHQGGSLGRAQLERAARRLSEGEPDACRVVALHHHLVGAPWRSRKRPLHRRSAALTRLLEAGAELIVSGHIHQGAVCESREFEIGRAGVIVTTAPGLGRPRPRRRGEACGALAYVVEADTIRVETYLWRQPDFALSATRLFPRASGRLEAEPLADAAGV
jgi:3',5'-cyclic AMP phosphodiesterase CpdA